LDLKTALGATSGASATKFSLYIPDRDRDGKLVEGLELWKAAAMNLFAEVNGGATLLPPAQGIWKPEGGGEIVREATSIVYSFIRDEKQFSRGLKRLAAFIHTFGKHANQGEVMVEFSGELPGGRYVSRAYFIDEYDKAGEKPF
jgi:hypothetical protein